MRSCLVIGGRGFVGSAMAARARDLGLVVSAIGRDDYGEAVGRRFDVVVFAAGNARRYLADRDPSADLDASVGAVYRALRDFPSERFVLASTVDVYPDPSRLEATREDAPIDPARPSTYGFHKRLAELVTMRDAPGWLIVRLGQMLGPGLRKGPVFDALHGEPLRVSPASRYPFLRTSSVAELTFALLEAGATEAVYNVCGRGSVALADALPEPPAVRRARPPRSTRSTSARSPAGSRSRRPPTRRARSARRPRADDLRRHLRGARVPGGGVLTILVAIFEARAFREAAC